MPTEPPPCKFWVKGSCAFGNACRFPHPAREAAPGGSSRSSQGGAGGGGGAPPPQKVCQHFLRGNCAFGDKCRNAHTVPLDSNPQEAGGSGVRGGRWGGDEDRFGAPEAVRDQLLGPMARLSFAEEERSWGGRGDTECGICFESIRDKGERFGLLQGCDHAFCLSCIRSWRQQQEQDRKNKRLCPICRNESFFVIPSDTLIMDQEEKQRVIEQFRDERSRIPCKLFNYGHGTCPFGTSCHYAHLNEDGTRYIPPPLRWMAGGSGSEVRGEVKLCDFFK